MSSSKKKDNYFSGIDVGASATKAVVIDKSGKVLGSAVVKSGFDFAAAADRALDESLNKAGLGRDALTRLFATGYGRDNVAGSHGKRTEIACHGRAAHHLFPGRPLTVVDIGGQDNKVIHLGPDGRRDRFKMNRKCAAGTGAFIEEIAARIEVPISDLDRLARQSTAEVSIGSFCTVFSATEILGLVRRGVKTPDIVKGVFRSVLKRIVEMDPLEGEVVLTGGVAGHNPIVIEMLSGMLGREVRVAPEPQLAGALGAALFARDSGAADEDDSDTP